MIKFIINIKNGMERGKMNTTLEYYNQNAMSFVQGTKDVDFKIIQENFIKRVPEGSNILDFGCGSGRDTKYFLEQGYQVTAIDGSEELCKIASEYTGIQVKQMLFQELNEINVYDGIWACSSILHLPIKELELVLKKIAIALKENGVLYTSFKYGTFAGERNGRYFTDMTENTFKELLLKVPELVIEDVTITTDVRPGRGEEQWLNLILRKQ